MKLFHLIICLSVLALINNTNIVANSTENHSQPTEHHTQEMDDDLDFSSTEFIEPSTYQMASPAQKGYIPAIIIASSVWGLFFYLLRCRRKPKSL